MGAIPPGNNILRIYAYKERLASLFLSLNI